MVTVTYSESLFRTFKYRPEYPVKGFGTIDASRQWVTGFFKWYNEEHRHSAIRYVTRAVQFYLNNLNIRKYDILSHGYTGNNCYIRPDYRKCASGIILEIGTYRKFYAELSNYYLELNSPGYVTPSQRHNKEDIHILAGRHEIYQQARQRRKNRWSGAARNWEPISEVWLNRPLEAESSVSVIAHAV